MPQLPAFLATPVARWFGLAAQVSAVDDLGPWLRRVQFTGDDLRGKPWRAGQDIEVHVGDGAFRHYTPMAWDPVAGSCSVVFHVHGHGPGSRWSSGLGVGDTVHILGPGGRFGLVPAVRHLLVGDETAIGLFAAMHAASPHASHCVIEVDEDPAAVHAVLPAAHVVLRRADRGDALAAALRARARAGDVVYAVGHAASIRRLRSLWIDELRLPPAAVRVRAYWADDRRGL